MGEVKVKLTLQNDGDVYLCDQGQLPRERIKAVEVDFVVDTGAVMTLLPQEAVEALGLKIFGRSIVTLANEQKIEMGRAGTISLTIAGRTMKIDCLVGPPGCEPLLGQIVLEGLDLIVDPARQTLTPRPESPYLPTLKMKSLAWAPAHS